jgi:hypothetical protein
MAPNRGMSCEPLVIVEPHVTLGPSLGTPPALDMQLDHAIAASYATTFRASFSVLSGKNFIQWESVDDDRFLCAGPDPGESSSRSSRGRRGSWWQLLHLLKHVLVLHALQKAVDNKRHELHPEHKHTREGLDDDTEQQQSAVGTSFSRRTRSGGQS